MWEFKAFYEWRGNKMYWICWHEIFEKEIEITTLRLHDSRTQRENRILLRYEIDRKQRDHNILFPKSKYFFGKPNTSTGRWHCSREENEDFLWKIIRSSEMTLLSRKVRAKTPKNESSIPLKKVPLYKKKIKSDISELASNRGESRRSNCWMGYANKRKW